MGTMKYQFILGLFLLGACTSTTVETNKGLDPVQTPGGLCQKWADAACNPTVVTNCGAANAAACVAKQKQFCENLLTSKGLSGPFVLAKANACVEAVKTAYAPPASLTTTERDTVLQLGYPCDTLEVEGTDAGSDGGCGAAVCKYGGQTCGGVDEACVPGFYCNGSYCIESPAAGAACCVGFPSCAMTITCQVAYLCAGAEGSQTCVARNPRGGMCTTDPECAEGLFCSAATSGICVDTLVLSVNEPVCQNFR
jgi:hypothetical protein